MRGDAEILYVDWILMGIGLLLLLSGDWVGILVAGVGLAVHAFIG